MRRLSAAVVGLTALALVVSSCGKDTNAPEGPGAPVKLSVSAGDNQKGTAGDPLLAPIAAKVTDARGRGVPNIEVTFIADAAAGAVAPASTRTNGAGIATTVWTMPTTPGIARVRAFFVDSTTGAVVDTVSFHAAISGSSAATMYPLVDNATIAAKGQAVPLSVTLYDRYGNRSPGATVTWLILSGGGTVSSTTSTSDSTGVAKTTLTLGPASGWNIVQASSGTARIELDVRGVTPGVPATVAQGPYTTLGLIGSTVTISAVVRDSLNAVVPGVSVGWTVTQGGGSVTPTTSTTDANGVATTRWTLGTTIGQNVLVASLGSLSAMFSIYGQEIAPQLTSVGTPAFGIGRTAGGTFVVSEIDAHQVALFDESTPARQRLVDVGGTPVVVAVDPTGTTAYVSNMNDWVDVISIANASTVRIPVAHAHSLGLSPDGGRLFVTSYDSMVTAVNTSTRQVVGTVHIVNGPWGIAFRTTGTDTLMYVTSRDGGTITEVNTRTLAILRTFTVGGRPHGLVISVDQSTLYAADNANGQIDVVDMASGAVTATIPFPGAFQLAMSPDGATLYASSINAKVAVISTASLTITHSYDVAGSANQVVASPDGTTAWVADQAGAIDIIKR